MDIGASEYNAPPFVLREVVLDEGGGLQLTWNSQPNDTYRIWSCVDLSSDSWLEEATVPAGGAATTWTDSDTTSTRKFYRIEIE